MLHCSERAKHSGLPFFAAIISTSRESKPRSVFVDDMIGSSDVTARLIVFRNVALLAARSKSLHCCVRRDDRRGVCCI
jgi:hypothetical protein